MVLIVAHLVIRAWLVATGNFYWDDLVLIGRASTQSVWSWDYLGHSHDGHFMPAAFLVAGISTLAAPVNWLVPAVTLVVLQGLASLSVWRMIRVVLGAAGDRLGARRPAIEVGALAALAFYLFTPLTVPAYIWWAAGLNSLPMQAAMAWIVADAVLLCTGRVSDSSRRFVVIRSTVIFVVALAFFEKSLFILPVAFIAAVLTVRVPTGSDGTGNTADGTGKTADGTGDGVPRTPLVVAFTRGRALWTPLAVVFVVWVIVYFSVSDATAGTHSVTQTAQLVWRSINKALVPSLIGGPWDWERWVPSPPMGFPAVWMIVVGWVVVAGFVLWAIRTRAGAIGVLIAMALYVVVAQIPPMWNRSSANTPLELAQTMRYLPDAALVLSLGFVLLLVSPARVPGPRAGVSARHAHGADTSTSPLVLAGVMAVAFAVASSIISTAAYSTSWRDDPTGPYLANAKRALAANKDTTMFDQALPLEVLLPVAYPENQISHTFGRLRDRPTFGDHTDRLVVLDNSGNAVPGAVTPRRSIPAGRGSCTKPELDGPRRLSLDGPLIQWRWTIALGYCANSAGQLRLSLDGGAPVTVPVDAGLHVVYVQLDGHGTELDVRPLSPGLAVHTGAGRVGEVVDARLLGG
ncbi:hypothetical protein GOOTI_108_00100 [Gordonia otitidis NBRC 100426]|uniref:Transmembrane protein n=2 Tax=Gordonia otitidis TaxID=249058 RepID=H5TLR0_GORO1|nr:hypothetical protein [Gordonia otitidis]GAB34418.1 hypothetical protein GOOTI_108_00100 [Gordonia otitidis NBRC 100426]